MGSSCSKSPSLGVEKDETPHNATRSNGAKKPAKKLLSGKNITVVDPFRWMHCRQVILKIIFTLWSILIASN